MHLSHPVFRLKRNARRMSRDLSIPLHEALDRIAIAEGFKGWSHLAAAQPALSPADRILNQIAPGELVLLGARPGQGKTMLGLELAARAAHHGRAGCFFTLDYHARDVQDRIAGLGVDPAGPAPILIDTSDDITAGHVIARLAAVEGAALVVIDYLQLLDQKRSNPDLPSQIGALKAHARATGAIHILISQIDRSFDLSGRDMPELRDIRQPNPFDLTAFDRICMLHEGQIRITAGTPAPTM